MQPDPRFIAADTAALLNVSHEALPNDRAAVRMPAAGLDTAASGLAEHSECRGVSDLERDCMSEDVTVGKHSPATLLDALRRGMHDTRGDCRAMPGRKRA